MSLILYFPLMGGVLAGLLYLVSLNFNERYSKAINLLGWIIATSLMLITFINSLVFINKIIASSTDFNIVLYHWLTSVGLSVNFALKFNMLTMFMCVLITFISFLVYFYSLGYIGLEKKGQIAKFVSYLSFFSFFMILLVTADNLLVMFLGWEGISLFSYFLISFLYKNKNAVTFANKAFIINRVADFAFLIGIFLVFKTFGNLNLTYIFNHLSSNLGTVSILGGRFSILDIICWAFLLAAMGKSAQVFFHVWLPDAMEAPTPVSALLHAATMVTAGVFLIVRVSPIFNYTPNILIIISIIGGITAFLGASIALTSSNIKKIIAYSTVSQIGYMFLALGIQFYNGAIFHIFTHAFFKSCLFLCAGIVIHNMQGEQNVFKMGGLWKKMPIVYLATWIGALSLSGLPPFSGYFSKDQILNKLFVLHDNKFYLFAYILGVFSTFLTAIYSLKLIFLVFHNKKSAPKEFHKHYSFTMVASVVVLATLALIAGKLYMNIFIGGGSLAFWNNSISIVEAGYEPKIIIFKYLPIILTILGMITAYILYSGKHNKAQNLALSFPTIHKFLINKWYFDIVYYKVFVRNIMVLSRIFATGSERVFNQVGPYFLARLSYTLSVIFNKLQTGRFYHYVFMSLIVVLVLFLHFIIW